MTTNQQQWRYPAAGNRAAIGPRIPKKQSHTITNMQVTSTKQHKVRCCIPLSWNFDRWAAWQLGLYFSTGNNICCCDNIHCHSARNSTVQPSTVHTGRFPPLQYNPDTKTSPTNLLFDRKFLLSPFIALCPTLLVTLLERHHQC